MDMIGKYKNLKIKAVPLVEGVVPPPHIPETKQINVRGRVEHEAIIKDASWCKELGIDQSYEVMKYLKRWGGWLGE
jgi:hypothetical protein